jgi:predicted nuclease with TOPRIM domain
LEKRRATVENELIKTIVSQGAWAVLFVWLLIDTRKESKAREEKLQGIINKNQEVISELAEKFDVVESIQEDVTDIKIKLDKVG